MIDSRDKNIMNVLDWPTLIIYLVLVLMGWLNIYAAVYSEEHSSILDFTQKYGSQLILIIAALVIGGVILLIDHKFFTFFAFPIYGFTLILLVLVLAIGREVNGAKAWLAIGSFTIQPGEFAKVGTALAIAKYLSYYNAKVTEIKSLFVVLSLLAAPMGLIILQPDAGSLLVFLSFSFMLFREGVPGGYLLFGFVLGMLFFLSLMLPQMTLIIGIIVVGYLAFAVYTKKYRIALLGAAIFVGASLLTWAIMALMGQADKYYWVIIIGFFASGLSFLVITFFRRIRYVAAFVLFLMGSLLFTFSVDYVYNNVLGEHQKNRMDILLGKKSDPLGMGYNVNQSLIAVGSGGFLGKGYLQGTQTKYNFVPEQSTDFIFCTVGEEWGFVGSMVVLVLFFIMLYRLVDMAERQRSTFSRVFIYSAASIIFFHLAINVGMAIGLLPVIGIPLPFFSYGGSSLWSFTVLIFVSLRLDANRTELLK
jgi:rod shape determining protein RodA